MAQHADIVEIVAPREAMAGDRVDITVRIKNLYPATIGIMVGGAQEYGVAPWPGIEFPTNWANVLGGVTQSFSGYFTMPYRAVKIHAYSYYYAEGTWHFDDEMIRTIDLAAVPESELSSIEIISYARR